MSSAASATRELARRSPITKQLLKLDCFQFVPGDIILLCVEYELSYELLAGEYQYRNNWPEAYKCAVIAYDESSTNDENISYLAGCAWLYGLNVVKVNFEKAIQALERARRNGSCIATSLLAQLGMLTFGEQCKIFSDEYYDLDDCDDSYGKLFWANQFAMDSQCGCELSGLGIDDRKDPYALGNTLACTSAMVDAGGWHLSVLDEIKNAWSEIKRRAKECQDPRAILLVECCVRNVFFEYGKPALKDMMKIESTYEASARLGVASSQYFYGKAINDESWIEKAKSQGVNDVEKFEVMRQ